MTQTSPRLPNLALVGVGKAGTTSLFRYLSQHPAICPSVHKETRFFMSMSEAHGFATGELGDTAGYAREFRHCGHEPYRMEATPHYFHGGPRLVEAMNATLPDVQVVLTLRDPVARAWSIYRFAKHMLEVPEDMSFAEFIDRGFALHHAGALCSPEVGPYWTSIRGSLYSQYVPAWLETFGDRVHVVFFKHLVESPLGTVRELCRWLNIDDRYATAFTYSVENQTRLFRNRGIHRVAHFANQERLWRNLGWPKRTLRRVYWSLNGVGEHEAMPDTVREDLEEFFLPSNRLLARQLNDVGVTNLPPWLESAKVSQRGSPSRGGRHAARSEEAEPPFG